MFGKDAETAKDPESLAEALSEAGWEPAPAEDVAAGEIHVEAAYSFNVYRKGDELYIQDTPENRKLIEAGNFREIR